MPRLAASINNGCRLTHYAYTSPFLPSSIIPMLLEQRRYVKNIIRCGSLASAFRSMFCVLSEFWSYLIMHYYYALYNAERVYTFDGVESSLLCLTIQDTWSLVSADEISVTTCLFFLIISSSRKKKESVMHVDRLWLVFTY